MHCGDIKVISVLLGLQPHREDIETGQEPWLHLKKLLDDQLSCPGERRKSFLHVRLGLTLPMSCVTSQKSLNLSVPQFFPLLLLFNL